MKLVLVLALALIGAQAHAYTSASGNNPSAGSYDAETKVAVKSDVALYSDNILKGQALHYSESELTGLYKVSKFYSGTANAAGAIGFQAGIAGRSVATGDTAGFPVIVRGYAEAYYDAASPITVGGYLCIGTAATVKGRLVNCAASVSSKFIALESKASGTGTNLKVRVTSN